MPELHHITSASCTYSYSQNSKLLCHITYIIILQVFQYVRKNVCTFEQQRQKIEIREHLDTVIYLVPDMNVVSCNHS